MTLPSRIMIRSSLIYLTIGSSLGLILLINKAWEVQNGLWMLLPLHIEMMLFGWIIQLTLGVAYWIFPRYLGEQKRGNTAGAYLMVASLNVGILLMLIGELQLFPLDLSILGRSLEFIAVLIFISLHWKRVVTYNRS